MQPSNIQSGPLRLLLPGFLFLALLSDCKVVEAECLPYDAACQPLAVSILFAKRADSDQPCNPCKVFATQATYDGGLGGISGADSHCNADTLRPAGGTYKALLVDSGNRVACTTANCVTGGSSEHIDWVLQRNMQYNRIDGTPITLTNELALFVFPMTNAIDTASRPVWTGFDMVTPWSATAGSLCTDWTDPLGPGGRSATSDNTGYSTGMSNTTSGCGTTAALYCVEQ